MEKWEYYTTFIEAAMDEVDTMTEGMIPVGDHAKYSPYATMPELNRLGEKGWELISMEPVIIGRNEDVLIHPNNIIYWGRTYFCVFKRRI